MGIKVGNNEDGDSVDGEAEGGTVGLSEGTVDGENEGLEEGSSVGDCD